MECPYIQRKRAGDETYDICELNTKPCLIEHGLYRCIYWNEIKEEIMEEDIRLKHLGAVQDYMKEALKWIKKAEVEIKKPRYKGDKWRK